jgi:hypothetical protein
MRRRQFEPQIGICSPLELAYTAGGSKSGDVLANTQKFLLRTTDPHGIHTNTNRRTFNYHSSESEEIINGEKKTKRRIVLDSLVRIDDSIRGGEFNLIQEFDKINQRFPTVGNYHQNTYAMILFDKSIEAHIGALIIDEGKKEITLIDSKNLWFMTDRVRQTFSDSGRFKGYKFKVIYTDEQPWLDTSNCGLLSTNNLVRIKSIFASGKDVTKSRLLGNALTRAYDRTYQVAPGQNRLARFIDWDSNHPVLSLFATPLRLVQGILKVPLELGPRYVEEKCIEMREAVSGNLVEINRELKESKWKKFVDGLSRTIQLPTQGFRVLARTITSPITSMSEANNTRLRMKKMFGTKGSIAGGILMGLSGLFSVAGICAAVGATLGFALPALGISVPTAITSAISTHAAFAGTAASALGVPVATAPLAGAAGLACGTVATLTAGGKGVHSAVEEHKKSKATRSGPYRRLDEEIDPEDDDEWVLAEDTDGDDTQVAPKESRRSQARAEAVRESKPEEELDDEWLVVPGDQISSHVALAGAALDEDTDDFEWLTVSGKLGDRQVAPPVEPTRGPGSSDMFKASAVEAEPAAAAAPPAIK